MVCADVYGGRDSWWWRTRRRWRSSSGRRRVVEVVEVVVVVRESSWGLWIRSVGKRYPSTLRFPSTRRLYRMSGASKRGLLG
jgi:hypothetical protein